MLLPAVVLYLANRYESGIDFVTLGKKANKHISQNVELKLIVIDNQKVENVMLQF